MRRSSPNRRHHTVPAARPASAFVDSGAWIALRSRRDQHHAEAERLFRQALARRVPLLTTSLVVAETHRLTLFRAGAQAARRFLAVIDARHGVTIYYPGVAEHAAACRWLDRLGARPVTYTDAVSFAVMGAARCTHVLGFDQDFTAAGFTLWS